MKPAKLPLPSSTSLFPGSKAPPANLPEAALSHWHNRQTSDLLERLAKPVSSVSLGTRGRMAKAGLSVTIFGASGFLARYLVNRIGRQGSLVRVVTRGDDMSLRHLKPLADYGRLAPHYFDWRNEASVAACVPPGTDVVVNLIGKHYDTKHALPWWINNTVEDSHVGVTRMLARVARWNGVKHFVQVSSAKADLNSPSVWARTKAQSEVIAQQEFPGATIVRLGQLYGEEDRFLNFWAWMCKKFSVIPLVDGGSAMLRPLFVGDAAEGIHEVMSDWDSFAGERFDLVGEHTLSLRQVVEYVARTIQREPQLVDVSANNGPLGLVAKVLEKLPNPVLTQDQLELFRCSDNLSSPVGIQFKDLDIPTHSFESKAFSYLFRYRAGGHFVELRRFEEGSRDGAPHHVTHRLDEQPR